MTQERLHKLQHELAHARPDDVAGQARRSLRDGFGAVEAEVWLVDYQMAYLIPVSVSGKERLIGGDPVGRALTSQDTVVEAEPGGAATGVHLPLTVYGDRLGVLSLEFADAPGPDLLAELVIAAAAIARALDVAEGRTDHYRKARRRIRLTLAAEIQWDLLPGRSYTAAEFLLSGQLEPAYRVCGDTFDWAVGADHLTLTVTDGMGQGIDAALLTQLSTGALRNARRSGADLAEQAALASQAVYAQHRGHLHLRTVLLNIDFATGLVQAIEAGCPSIYLQRDGATTQLKLDSQLPLGMFNDTEYVQEQFYLHAGDRLFIISDGVHATRSPRGEVYNDVLIQVLDGVRGHHPSETVRLLTNGLLEHAGEAGLDDDAVIVCLDWTGQPPRPVIDLETHRTHRSRSEPTG